MLGLIKDALGSASRYVVTHPMTVFQVARHAVGLRWAIPLDAIRWVVRQLPPGGAVPEDIEIDTRPPAIRLGLTLNAMGTHVRVNGNVGVDRISIAPEELRVELDLRDFDARVIDNPNSPLVQLLKSMDLKKPASLVNFVPKKPKFLVSAKDNMVVLDLMKIPEVAENAALQRLLRTLTPVVNLRAIRTENDMLIVAFQARPSGIGELLANIRT